MSYEAWAEPDDYDCPSCAAMMSERDKNEEAAERLADCIAAMLDVDLGEHSNLNCPWTNAADHADAFVDGKSARLAKNERLAERLMMMAAKRSTETPFGWTHPDCETLQAAASTLRGAPQREPDLLPVGVLSDSQ